MDNDIEARKQHRYKNRKQRIQEEQLAHEEQIKEAEKIAFEEVKAKPSEVVELFESWEGFLPSKDLTYIARYLEDLTSENIGILKEIELKNPKTALILSVTLGWISIDRFYLGQIFLGILKILFGWLTLGLWYVIDWPLSFRKAQEINTHRILNVLATFGG